MLHVLTSDEVVARADFVAVAESLLRTLGRQGALHLRSRALSGIEYLALASRLAATAGEVGAMLVVNGRVDVAIVAGAHGVQLGRGALLPTDVRRIAPGLLVGASVHSVEEALGTGDTPDWLVAGHVYSTRSHPTAPGRGLRFLRAVVRSAVVPVVAVGGIKPEHVAPILRTGVAGVAVISGIWDARNPESAATRYLSKIW